MEGVLLVQTTTHTEATQSSRTGRRSTELTAEYVPASSLFVSGNCLKRHFSASLNPGVSTRTVICRVSSLCELELDVAGNTTRKHFW